MLIKRRIIVFEQQSVRIDVVPYSCEKKKKNRLIEAEGSLQILNKELYIFTEIFQFVLNSKSLCYIRKRKGEKMVIDTFYREFKRPKVMSSEITSYAVLYHYLVEQDNLFSQLPLLQLQKDIRKETRRKQKRKGCYCVFRVVSFRQQNKPRTI